MVPLEVTRAVLEDELPPARCWADRHGWILDAALDSLVITVRMPHPIGGESLVLRGDFHGYRALPPVWQFVDSSGVASRSVTPAGGSLHGQSSIFHPEGLICAHWSRAAYAEGGGPHGDWGAASGWASIGQGNQAHNLAEMLAAIDVHLRFSPGRLA
jgi:hypothetical protein